MNATMHVPLFHPPHELSLIGRKEIEKAVNRVLDSGQYVNGPETRVFEKELAAYCGGGYIAGVSSGTTAIELLLKALDLPPETEITTTAHTFVATVEGILNAGHIPHFVDIDPATWQMPATSLKGQPLLAPHLYGLMSEAATDHEAIAIEDASQALGAELSGKKAGAIARSGVFSFHPTKVLGAAGDAGAIITHDAELCEKVKAMRNHGQSSQKQHDYQGTTARMDEVQAAILRLKLAKLDKLIGQRREIDRFYRQELKDCPLQFPGQPTNVSPAPSLMVARTENRDDLRQYLREREIDTGLHYPTPVHKMPAYENRTWAQVILPETERLCRETLTLPLWAGMAEEEVSHVVQSVRAFFEE